MKGFVFVLLCALVAVQGRSTAVQKTTRAVASLGENPWVVHLRIAISTSGLLNSCVGSLISSRFVLTASSCVSDVRFIWSRYGAINVVNPALVIESSLVVLNRDYNVGILNLNRNIESSDNIAPVSLINNNGFPASGKFCGYGDGEILNCYDLNVVVEDDGSITVISDDAEVTAADVGAPLVSDGVQVAVLLEAGDEDSIGTFVPTADFLDWIEAETGLDLSPKPEVVPELEPEAEVIEPEIAPEAVRIVN